MTNTKKRRLGQQFVGSPFPAPKVQRIMSSLPDRMLSLSKQKECSEPSPDTTLKTLLKEKAKLEVEFIPYNAPQVVKENFFHHPTKEEIESYKHDVLDAVRNSDLEMLKKFHADKRPLKCSNAFGESILHLACRKNLVQVVRFLVETAGVPVRVSDDYGRSPLHDAVWVKQPNFELMDIVIGKCPDLLYIKDRRGHTPLGFARRDQWKAWNDYLKSKDADFLTPKLLMPSRKECEEASDDLRASC